MSPFADQIVNQCNKTPRVLQVAAPRSLGQGRRFRVRRRAKPNLIARVDWDPYCRCETQLSSAKQLAYRAHETTKAKLLGARDREGFAQSPRKTHAQNSTPRSASTFAPFFTIPCPRFRRSSPLRRTHLMKNTEKSRPIAADSHGKAALVQCLLPQPRLRNGPSALNLPRIRQRVVFLLRRQDATSPFLGSGLLTRR